MISPYLTRTLLGITLSTLCTTALATTTEDIASNKSNAHIALAYLQPNSNNLKYAVFVSGNQPYGQSWHNQSINPNYSPAIDAGLLYAFPQSAYNASLDWLHVNTSDTASKQASQSTAIATVQFVAPPYDVGPGVFGIKHASSTVSNNLDSVGLNIGRAFAYGSGVTGRLFTGLSFLNIRQDLSTTFNDYAGSPEIPGQAYALPADPSYYFNTDNTSHFTGVGPDLGINLQYQHASGWGVLAQFVGIVTAGTMRAADNFTSASARLAALGIGTSRQAITAPNATQLVPGIDSKIGLLFNRTWNGMGFTIEGGYRFAYYYNAISTIEPDTLVQARVDPTIPEFATGTMAINSTTSSSSPFSLSGPYLNFTVAIA